MGGPTDIDSMGLACEFDHRLPDEGWTVALNHDTATIEWTPPPWLDPTQTPQINQLRHPASSAGGGPRLSTRHLAGPATRSTQQPAPSEAGDGGTDIYTEAPQPP